MATRANVIVGVIKGGVLIIASFLALMPDLSGLARVDPDFLPGFLALSISVAFVLSVTGGYVIAASAGRKTMKRTILVAAAVLILALIVMVVSRDREALQFQIARTVALSAGVLLGGYLRTPQRFRSVQVVRVADPDLRSRLEKRVASSHEYTRHMITSLLSWYTFFVGVNYLSMGWFATNASKDSNIVILIASLFITQNALGIMACMRVKRYITESSEEVVVYEQSLAGLELSPRAREALVPSPVYTRAIQLMVIGLVVIVMSWMVLPFFMEKNIAIETLQKTLGWGSNAKTATGR